MRRTTKFATGILVAIGLLALGLLILNNFLEKKIKTGIEKGLEESHTTYNKVDVKLLNRTAEVLKPSVNLKGKSLQVDALKLNDIHLWEYIVNKNIIIGELKITNPVVKIFNLQDQEKDSVRKKKTSRFENNIEIKNVIVSGGSFQIFEKDSTQHRLFTKIRDVKMEQVKINAKTLKETVPFNYDLILLNADSIFYDLDKQHELVAGNFKIDNNQVLVKNLKIVPKFSKTEHQKTTPVEKDRYDLEIDSVSMKNFNWSLQNDSLKIQNSFTEITGVDFEIYRDKLQPDDTSFKPLYSKMIRELPILLNLDSIQVNKAYIRYEEKIHGDREPGVVEFSNLNGVIKNITNIGMDSKNFPKTIVDVNANFMKTAPLKVEWEFDISNKNDQFQFSGQMGRLGADQINNFLKPAMNVQASGKILDMYFNFYGNDTKGSGDMRLEYDSFKVEVLRKDARKKNKIISALANLIVQNEALNEEANYKEISFTRDKTKSFWNYVWNLVKNGALKSFL